MPQVQISVRQQFRIARESFPIFLPQTSEPVLFQFDGGQVEMRPPSAEDSETGFGSDYLICTVVVPTSVSEKRKRLLDELVRGRMPEGSKGPDLNSQFPDMEAEFYSSFVDEEGKLRDGRLPLLQYLPESLQTFVEEKCNVCCELCEVTLRMIRWRGGMRGGPTILNPHKYLEWSCNGYEWYSIWNGTMVGTSTWLSSPFREHWREYVDLHSQPVKEPLGHELFHEAYRLMDSNPRSALLMVITAAEVGVKHCIIGMVPDTAWLMDNAPSPPVLTMIQDYLPTLTANSSFRGRQVCPPPETLLVELKKAINARNTLAHAGDGAPNPESLVRKFDAVRDLLWLLDYYGGHEWAMEHVSRQTLDSCSPI